MRMMHVLVGETGAWNGATQFSWLGRIPRSIYHGSSRSPVLLLGQIKCAARPGSGSKRAASLRRTGQTIPHQPTGRSTKENSRQHEVKTLK